MEGSAYSTSQPSLASLSGEVAYNIVIWDALSVWQEWSLRQFWLSQLRYEINLVKLYVYVYTRTFCQDTSVSSIIYYEE